MFERFGELADRPLLYQAVDQIREGYRRSVYGAHAIYYRVRDDQVDIMRVLGREDASVLLRYTKETVDAVVRPGQGVTRVLTLPMCQ